MFHTILTPLDGSPFAEHALPYALSIARRTGASLDLVHVHVLYALEEHMVARYSYDPRIEEEHRQQEQLYLDGTAKWLAAVSSVPMTTAVLRGLNSEGILQRVQESKVDLVVMSTHGRSSVGRFFLGSVADEVMRRAGAPILLVRPQEQAPQVVPEPLLEHLLVPLDGSTRAERVLEPVLELVRAWEGRCTLVQVIDGGQPALPEQEAAARDYLQRIATRLRTEGVAVQAWVLVATNPAAAILEEAQRQDCHCIALATHGRGGVQRMLLGSVADKVVRGASIPVLVYRPVGA